MSIFKLNKKNFCIKIFDHVGIYATGITSYLHQEGYSNVHSATWDDYDVQEYELENAAGKYQLALYHVNLTDTAEEISEKVKTLRQLYSNAKIVLYSTVFSKQVLATVFANDLNGYFLLSEKPEKLMKVIAMVSKNLLSLSEDVVAEYLHKRRMITIKKAIRNIENASRWVNSGIL